jgi:hypothetical protein
MKLTRRVIKWEMPREPCCSIRGVTLVLVTCDDHYIYGRDGDRHWYMDPR